MSFSYQPMSESEAMSERFQLIKEGEYDAVIVSSEDRVSANSGNPMMDMTVRVYDAEGKTHDIRDFLVFTKGMMWKVVHFADSAGMMPQYEEGKLCSDIVTGARIRVKITVEEGNEIPVDKLKGKAFGSKYPDKNKVDDYLKRETQDGAVRQKPLEELDDAIPF